MATEIASLPSHSLWAASAFVPEFDAPALNGEKRVELAVVGGGFTGLSVALHSAERGASVAVLEAGEIGYGASGRNGGQVNPGVKLDEATLAARFGEAGRGLHRLAQDAPDFLNDLIARKGLRAQWRRPGLIRLAHNAAALATVRRAAETLRKAGVAVEDLDAASVERRVGTSRYPGGLFDPRGASVHPLDLVREMARAAGEAGAAIHAHSPAMQLKRDGGLWRVVTPQGALLARKVVVATNAYSDGLVKGLAQSLLPVNSFQVATAPLGALAEKLLPGGETVYDSRRLVLYFRKSPDQRLVMGGRASFSSARATSGQVADYSVLESVLHGVFPDLRDAAIEYRWTGLVGITLDYLPHYHALDDDLHVLVGYNGRGVALSHRLGAWLADRLTGSQEKTEIPATPIRPFPLHRFRAPILNLGMQWNRLLDVIGR
jgi:sarcosine oxidase